MTDIFIKKKHTYKSRYYTTISANCLIAHNVQSWRPNDVGDGKGSGSESAKRSDRESAQQSPNSSSQLANGTGGRHDNPEIYR